MASQVNFTIRDFSDELSGVQFNIDDVDETSWVATQTQIAAVQSALAALTIGTIARRSLVAENVAVNDVRPVNPFAQRETGLRLFYQDTNNQKRYHLTIPCPDLLLVGSGGTDDVDLSGVSVVNAIVNALEIFMRSPDGGPVNFYRGTIVGRRS